MGQLFQEKMPVNPNNYRNIHLSKANPCGTCFLKKKKELF
jgi:hypothetical protein